MDDSVVMVDGLMSPLISLQFRDVSKKNLKSDRVSVLLLLCLMAFIFYILIEKVHHVHCICLGVVKFLVE